MLTSGYEFNTYLNFDKFDKCPNHDTPFISSSSANVYWSRLVCPIGSNHSENFPSSNSAVEPRRVKIDVSAEGASVEEVMEILTN